MKKNIREGGGGRWRRKEKKKIGKWQTIKTNKMRMKNFSLCVFDRKSMTNEAKNQIQTR